MIKKISKDDKNYPLFVCLDCGEKASKVKCQGVIKIYEGTCEVCQENKSIISTRNFGYPIFKVEDNE